MYIDLDCDGYIFYNVHEYTEYTQARYNFKSSFKDYSLYLALNREPSSG